MTGSQIMQMGGAFLLGAVLAAGAVYAWCSHRLRLERQRVLHVEHSRQQVLEQVTHARRQIEQLQRESHELRLAIRPAPRHAPVPAPAQDAAEAARQYAESLLKPPPATDKPQAFKDTVVLRRGPG
ncbi:hypothetical protein [Roseateles sp.]|uniref:hypothetical protein n=1 Tax=Roseateles sp. TaxID=1971397 RepID=UPI0025E94CEF|nr:hypothetical protein [Roseateles sp.]MBV8035239.1 hypothetical protein [Roseateles sp.]